MLSTINFSRKDGCYYSDPVKAEGSNIVFRVEFSQPGKIMLERSITGEKFVPERLLNPEDEMLIIERGVYGITPGQFLRLSILGGTPLSIQVLQ